MVSPFALRQLTIDSVMWLRDLPVVIANETVSSFFSDYGLVKSSGWITAALTISPTVRNGNRLVKILLAQEIPFFVCAESCDCRVWYSGQPPQCSIYLESGHRSPACPLSGLCRRCRQPDHMARECTQAWALQSLFLPSWIRPLNHLLHLTMLWLTHLLLLTVFLFALLLALIL